MYFECSILNWLSHGFGQAATLVKTWCKMFGEKWRNGTFFKIKLNVELIADISHQSAPINPNDLWNLCIPLIQFSYFHVHAFSLKVRLKIILSEISWLFYKSYAKYIGYILESILFIIRSRRIKIISLFGHIVQQTHGWNCEGKSHRLYSTAIKSMESRLYVTSYVTLSVQF